MVSDGVLLLRGNLTIWTNTAKVLAPAAANFVYIELIFLFRFRVSRVFLKLMYLDFFLLPMYLELG